jgi:N-acetyl-anhydromuramyl-L-alanine amidase AmpD
MSTRVTPHVEVTHWSPNYSDRGAAHPTLIVIHVTAGHNRPGISDLLGLGDWFGQRSSEVSSHVATDNEGNSARFVHDSEKAWHVAAYNRMALGIEQVAPGDGTEITRDMYRETARWVARWSKTYGIPIRKAQVTSSGVILRSGVIRHSELGRLGGGHSDPGGYDMHAMLALARFYRGKL